MTFLELLKRWNKGVERGAQSKFALAIGVDQSAVSRWSKGIAPGPDMITRIAKELKIPPEDLMESFNSVPGYRDTQKSVLLSIFNDKEREALGKISEDHIRDEIEVVRWLVSEFSQGRLVPAGSPQAPQVPMGDVGVPKPSKSVPEGREESSSIEAGKKSSGSHGR